jgi:hypothetical protein
MQRTENSTSIIVRWTSTAESDLLHRNVAISSAYAMLWLVMAAFGSDIVALTLRRFSEWRTSPTGFSQRSTLCAGHAFEMPLTKDADRLRQSACG